jgi:hypothetical protein
LASRQTPQFVVYEGEKLIRGCVLPGLKLVEEDGYL